MAAALANYFQTCFSIDIDCFAVVAVYWAVAYFKTHVKDFTHVD